jgi:hypothetical protein
MRSLRNADRKPVRLIKRDRITVNVASQKGFGAAS